MHNTTCSRHTKYPFVLALWVLLMAMYTGSVAASNVFIDNFQSCDFNHNEASVGWLLGGASANPTLIGNNAPCTAEPPCTTQHCARFEFVGNSDPASDAQRELRYALTTSSNWEEIWVEWSQFFPTSWSHRDGTGSDKNQLFTVRTTSGAVFVELAFDLINNNTAQETIVGSARIEQLTGQPAVTINLNQSDTIPDVINPLAGKKERWINMRAHVKLATDGMTNGMVQFWMDGQPIIDARNLDLQSTQSTNRIAGGRLMGLAASGFTTTGLTYITDVYVSQRPRFNVAFLMDKSGSMGGRTNPSDNMSLQKMETAKQAASATITTLLPYMSRVDKLGIVYFDTDAHTTLINGSIFRDINNLSTIIDCLNNPTCQPAGGLTSIGDAMTASKEQGFNLQSAPYQLNLLVTDGYQTADRYIAEVPRPDTGIAGGSNEIYIDTVRFVDAANLTPEKKYPGNIYTCVVSIGMGTAQWYTFNNDLNNRRCRDKLDASPDVALANVNGNLSVLTSGLISNFIANLGIGDKVEKVKEKIAALDASGKAETDFIVSKEDIRLSIIVSWQNREITADKMKILLQGPDGIIELDPDKHIRSGLQYKVISFPLPLEPNDTTAFDGNWKITLAQQGTPVKASDYGIIILADNQSISSSFTIDAGDYGTGDTIPLTVRLKEKGLPIKDATVVAQILQPNESVGNVLSTNQTTDTGQDGLGDAFTTAEEKLFKLLKNRQIYNALRPVLGEQVTLSDPDGDGVYTGHYRGLHTKVPGNYQFTFLVNGQTTDNGQFLRTQQQTVYVKPKPSLANTKVSIDWGDGGLSNITLILEPRDKFNNYLGPGYSDVIKFDIPGAKFIGNINDTLNGSYQQKMDLSALTKDSKINIKIGGKDAFKKRWGELTGIPKEIAIWLFLLIALMLL